jgi:hypothetical protein
MSARSLPPTFEQQPILTCPLSGKSAVDSGHGNRLTIALSVQAKEYPERFLWAQDHAFALEYTPDPLAIQLIEPQLRPFLTAQTPVRWHCRFFHFEMGNADPREAEEAFRMHADVVTAVAGIGEPVITVHLNLLPSAPFDCGRGVENLSRLVEHAGKLGMTVCLENLRRGPTSNPRQVLAWAQASGAMITLDIGHAVSSDLVKGGEMTLVEVIEIFRERLHHVHMYDREEDRHYPIEDLAAKKAAIDRLLSLGARCSWWTIELDDCGEALHTREILTDYINNRIAGKAMQNNYGGVDDEIE